MSIDEKVKPIVKFNAVKESIFNIRGTDVILDKDVAKLYEVETKRINEAVKNNPDKFPEGYVLQLTKDDISHLRSNCSTTNVPSMTRVKIIRN